MAGIRSRHFPDVTSEALAPLYLAVFLLSLELVRNLVAHGDAREGK